MQHDTDRARHTRAGNCMCHAPAPCGCPAPARHVPCHPHSCVEAPSLYTGAGAATGPQVHRHGDRATAAALGGARQPHGLRDAPTASHAFVVGATSAGAPTMTYGRSIFKAMDKLQVDTARWHELAANRGAWRELRTGLAPPAFRPQARPSSPAPRISRMKPVRSCARATVAAIDATLQRERQPF